MSAYKQFIDIQFANGELLVKALAELGYKAQVGQDLEMHGWGSQRQQAQIVVDHTQIEKSAYDLGFVWNGKAFVPVIEDYAARHVLDEEWRNRLQATYAKLAILTFLARKGAKIGQVQTLQDGSLAFSAAMEVTTR